MAAAAGGPRRVLDAAEQALYSRCPHRLDGLRWSLLRPDAPPDMARKSVSTGILQHTFADAPPAVYVFTLRALEAPGVVARPHQLLVVASDGRSVAYVGDEVRLCLATCGVCFLLVVAAASCCRLCTLLTGCAGRTSSTSGRSKALAWCRTRACLRGSRCIFATTRGRTATRSLTMTSTAPRCASLCPCNCSYDSTRCESHAAGDCS